jgi:hypothetical protein
MGLFAGLQGSTCLPYPYFVALMRTLLLRCRTALWLVASVFLLAIAMEWGYLVFSGEEELFLLPDHFHGVVILLFDRADGQVRRYEYGKRVYQVPATGVLRTQFPPNSSVHPLPTFHYMRAGQRVALAPPVRAQAMQAGTAYGPRPSHEAKYLSVLVGSPQELDSLALLRERMDISIF